MSASEVVAAHGFSRYRLRWVLGGQLAEADLRSEHSQRLPKGAAFSWEEVRGC